jgi:rRNA maturation endonuclease Nob1
MTARNANLSTADAVRCPTCERVSKILGADYPNEICQHCGDNIGHTFGKAWERTFPTFYDGTIPERFRV